MYGQIQCGQIEGGELWINHILSLDSRISLNKVRLMHTHQCQMDIDLDYAEFIVAQS